MNTSINGTNGNHYTQGGNIKGTPSRTRERKRAKLKGAGWRKPEPTDTALVSKAYLREPGRKTGAVRQYTPAEIAAFNEANK